MRGWKRPQFILACPATRKDNWQNVYGKTPIKRSSFSLSECFYLGLQAFHLLK